MNPGYLSLVLYVMMCILLASGWKDILFRGFSRASFLLFFAGWIPFSLYSFHVAHGLRLQGTAVFLLLLALAGTWHLRGLTLRLHVWSSGLFLGLFDFLMLELNGWNMLADQAGPFFHSSVVLAVLAMLLGRNPIWQFTALTIGLLAGEFIHVWLHRQAAPALVAGGAAFSDHWWLSVCLARGLTVSLEHAGRYILEAGKHWSERRKEWRE